MLFILHSYLSQPPCICVCVRVRTGLRDWYLRNTIGSNHQSQVNGKVDTGVSAKVNGGVKGQTGRGGALQIRRKTIGVVEQPSYQMDTNHHRAPPHRKRMLPHSATFHGHPLHGRFGSVSLQMAPLHLRAVLIRFSLNMNFTSFGCFYMHAHQSLTCSLHHHRSMDGALCQDAFPALKQETPPQDPALDHPSPGTLV